MLFTGVSNPRGRRWVASIYADGRSQYIGRFDNEKAAARAYDKKAKQPHINPILNVLPDGSPNPDRKSRFVDGIEKRTTDASVTFPV